MLAAHCLHPVLALGASLLRVPDPTPGAAAVASIGNWRAAAAIAQLGERQTEDLKVPGSIPGLGILWSSAYKISG